TGQGTGASAASGTITFEFATSASASVSSLVSGKTFELNRDNNGTWECRAGTTGIAVTDDLLPKNCR
ncbi:pilin, partial [Vibrio cyclitrophicus]